jgi:anti-anti-sigma factor
LAPGDPTTEAALFRIAERDDPDGARRLTLTGELDLASGSQLRDRLRELGAAGATVRLDLSQLDFMDSTGIGIIVRGLRDSARDGWKLEVDPNMPRQIARLIALTGIDAGRALEDGKGPSHARQGAAPRLP